MNLAIRQVQASVGRPLIDLAILVTAREHDSQYDWTMNEPVERQLDSTGGEYLKRKIENLGIRVMLPKQTAALFGNGHVDGLRFASGEELNADLVVIAAGIRPNVDLGRQAGLDVRRGIVVNDFMQTSDANIYAVGECTEHRGQTFGLVAPLFEQGRVLANAISGNPGNPFAGAAPASNFAGAL